MKLVKCYVYRRSGHLEVQERDFEHVGAEFLHEKDSPALLTQQKFTGALEPIPTTPEAQASRQRPLPMGGGRIYQCYLGGFVGLQRRRSRTSVRVRRNWQRGPMPSRAVIFTELMISSKPRRSGSRPRR